MENKKRIIVKENISKELVFDSLECLQETTITVEKNASLKFNVALLSNANNSTIKIVLKENANLDFSLADFSNDSFNLTVLVNLEGQHSNATWKLSSLSKNDEKKIFDISFIHRDENTTSSMSNYGVGMDNSKLVFKGVSHILNGAKKAVASQQAKIIIFDDGVDASSSPSLRIDENDVKASHAAIVGKLNEEHLYYLMSRGLNEDEARRLITFGYLSPIADNFDDQKKEAILSMIRSRF